VLDHLYSVIENGIENCQCLVYNVYVNVMCVILVKLLHTYSLGGWWRWALVSPDGVAPSQVSASLAP